MRDQVYIPKVGGKPPSPDLLKPIANCNYANKPYYGMWTSSLVKGRSHWQRVCASPKGRLAYLSQYWDSKQPYVLHVRKDAMVLHVKNQDNINRLPITTNGYIDFEKLSTMYDGIHILKKTVNLFYAYDVECTIWFRWCFD